MQLVNTDVLASVKEVEESTVTNTTVPFPSGYSRLQADNPRVDVTPASIEISEVPRIIRSSSDKVGSAVKEMCVRTSVLPVDAEIRGCE